MVELLIAVTLGLLILAGVGSVFLGSKQSFRTQDNLGQVQESGRFVNFLLVPRIRNAGYLPDPLTQIDPTALFLEPAVVSQDQRRAVWGENNVAEGTGNFWAVDAEGGTDILVVRQLGQSGFGGVMGTPDGSGLVTCQGQPVASNEIAESIFFIENVAAGQVPSLQCRSRVIDIGAGPPPAPPPQPLIRGITDLQIQYGVDTNPVDDAPPPPALPGLFPDRFVTADEINGDATGVLDWTRVVAVKIEVTAVGEDQSEGAVGGFTVTAADEDQLAVRSIEARRLQRSFTNTVYIRNRLRQ